jgi:rhodanese-related sulfurtransferase
MIVPEQKRRKIVFIAPLLLMSAVFLRGQQPASGHLPWPSSTSQTVNKTGPTGIHNVSCEQAHKIIQEHRGDSNFVILDFRTKEMFDQAHIEGAIVHDAFSSDIDTWLESLDKNKVYLIYCTLGQRSGIALGKMKELKFENIYHMYEGLAQWKKLGYETVSSGGPEPQGPPPGSYKMLSGKSSTTVPFEIIRNHIILKAGVNGNEIRLALDSGLGADGAVLFGSPEIEKLGLKFAGEARVSGAGEGDMVPAKFSPGNTINLPGLDLTEQTLIVMPPDPARAVIFGHEDGAIGGSLLNHLVVGIDFDKNILQLSENNDFTYSGPGQKLTMTRMPDGAPCLSGSVEMVPGVSTQLGFVLDLGAGNALSLNTRSNESIKIPQSAIEHSLGFGIQGELMGHIGRIAALHIGPYLLKDVVTSFSQSEALNKIEGGRGNIGMGILRRFNIIFDVAHHQIIVEPNAHFTEPFEFNMSGLHLQRRADQRYRVARVVPGSSGEEAGILVDDVVIEINGLTADKVSQDDLDFTLKQVGRLVVFKIERAGKEIEFKVRLRRIL